MTPCQLCACLVLLLCLASSNAFTVPTFFRTLSFQNHAATVLFSTPPRQPRRNLKKRRRNRKRGDQVPASRSTPEFPWDTAESRPIVSFKSREAGEDYWIDEADLAKSLQQKQAIQNRKAMEGEIPKEKLWSEVLSPYKQNWIGIFSMIIVILITIGTQFPELLNQPVIPIPDL